MAAVPINEMLGLIGDDNPHSTSPPGSMDVANNIVFRRQNVAEPRPGFDYYSVTLNADEGGEA